jgi:hypothetical protein
MPWRRVGEWRYGSIILELGTRWRWVVSFAGLPLYPSGRDPSVHWIGGWVGSRAGVVEKRKILHCRESNAGLSSSNPSLYWLSYPNSWFKSEELYKWLSNTNPTSWEIRVCYSMSRNWVNSFYISLGLIIWGSHTRQVRRIVIWESIRTDIIKKTQKV